MAKLQNKQRAQVAASACKIIDKSALSAQFLEQGGLKFNDNRAFLIIYVSLPSSEDPFNQQSSGYFAAKPRNRFGKF